MAHVDIDLKLSSIKFHIYLDFIFINPPQTPQNHITYTLPKQTGDSMVYLYQGVTNNLKKRKKKVHCNFQFNFQFSATFYNHSVVPVFPHLNTWKSVGQIVIFHWQERILQRLQPLRNIHVHKLCGNFQLYSSFKIILNLNFNLTSSHIVVRIDTSPLLLPEAASVHLQNHELASRVIQTG